MKKFLVTMLFVVTFFILGASEASAVANDTVKVGLRYGSDALYSANLENEVGRGYSFGYYDARRNFQELGYTDETTISITASGNIAVSSSGYSEGTSGSQGVIGKYHVQLDRTFDSYEDAEYAAMDYDGAYPAYVSDAFVVRIGSYTSQKEANSRLSGLGVSGSLVSGSSTGVVVTVTQTTEVLFEFDCQGAESLAILPDGQDEKAETWFKGYRYNGGFEYNRITGGNINVINVVDLEDYVKGVLPHEMGGGWPEEALKAQAVCARTFACSNTKHLSSYGFDVCNTTDCQVYNGHSGASDATDWAVDATEGECIYADGELIEALYFSSDGGATEDSQVVFGGVTSYLVGKEDPYEATISIPDYSYTVTYTPAQLTWVLQNSGYTIGTIQNVYVSEYTDLGNVAKVTFVDTSGKTLTLKGDKARSAFYSTTYGKAVKSMRFTISGGSSAPCYVNSASNPLDSLKGASVISGGGSVSTYKGSEAYVITSSGTAALSSGGTSGSAEEFVITGTGNGHNVGMSQYGANAMAKLGYDYEDILHFYYTDVTIR